MKIEITDHRKIYTVQKEFSQLFPFLKIEFYAKPNTSDGKSSSKLVRHAAKNLGSCRTIHTKGTITLSPNMTVNQLRSIFFERYGLTIKVSRMSGSEWINTDDTEQWTLEKQNRQGELLPTEQQTA